MSGNHGRTHDGFSIDWSVGIEEVLRQLQNVFQSLLSGSDYFIIRNTTPKEKNLNIYQKGNPHRVGQVWPKVRSQTMDFVFTVEEIDSLKTRVALPQDSDVKQEGRYPGLRRFKQVELSMGAEIIKALAAGSTSAFDHKRLLVIDMQNDFIDGALGTREAEAIIPAVIAKIRSYPSDKVFATMDTHEQDYLSTQEGRKLPVEHCVRGTNGWQLYPDIAALLSGNHIYEKPTFGSMRLAEDLAMIPDLEEIELIGLCTDICVVSNALLLKARMPEVQITVDASCCAGVTPEKHAAALETMRSCQVEVIG